MNQLNEIVKNYLVTDTNHAIMISGKWGVGKTFYLKNTLLREITSTRCLNDNRKSYKPAYVSLFGLRSIEEVQAQILLAIYPILKSKNFKVGAALSKSLIKGFLQLKGLGMFSDMVDIDLDDKSAFLNLHEIVICFDDLERMSQDLKLEELIGYVNSIVEDDNVKILIIANEDKIDNKNYFDLKEKTVSNTIEFVPDLKGVLNDIIAVKYIAFKVFKTFLESNNKFICSEFEKYSVNLRILIYALDSFHKVFSHLEIEISNHKPLSQIKNDLFCQIFKFILVISIEYKKGTVSFLNRMDLDTANPGIHRMLMLSSPDNRFSNQNEEKEKEFWEVFVDTYYAKDEYVFYDSLYTFVTGGEPFRIDKLISELKSQHHIEDNEVLRQYEILSLLHHNSVVKLSQKNYSSLTKEMLQFAYDGKYDLSEYLGIFHYAIRFGNPFRFNPQTLSIKLKRGIRTRELVQKYVPSLNIYHDLQKEADYYEEKLELRRYLIEQNTKILERSRLLDAKKMVSLFFADLNVFKDKLIELAQQNNQVSIFHVMSDYKFYLSFNKSTNNRKWEIIELFQLYYYQFNPALHKGELGFLCGLQGRLQRKMNIPSIKGIDAYLLEVLISDLDGVISKIKTATNK